VVDSLPDDVRNFARQGRDMAANGAQAAADYASPRLVSLRENLGLLHSQIRQVCVCARGTFKVRNLTRQGRDMAANGAQAAADYASPRLVSLRENLGLLHSQIRQVCLCARGELLKYGIFARQGRDMAANGAQAAADYASPRLASLRENLGLLHSQIRQVCVCARGDTLKYGILRGKGAIWRPTGSGYLYSTVSWIQCSGFEWIRSYWLP
jgi:hypothetical protein